MFNYFSRRSFQRGAAIFLGYRRLLTLLKGSIAPLERHRPAGICSQHHQTLEINMFRKFVIAGLLSAAGLTSLSLPAAFATNAIQDNYCLQGRIWGYPGNCEFSNYQQCLASASGTDAYCGINPMRAYAPRRPQRWHG
jgi:hypothetical protein